MCLAASFNTNSLSVSFIHSVPPHPGESDNGKDKAEMQNHQVECRALHHQPHRLLAAVSISKLLRHDVTELGSSKVCWERG